MEESRQTQEIFASYQSLLSMETSKKEESGMTWTTSGGLGDTGGWIGLPGRRTGSILDLWV